MSLPSPTLAPVINTVFSGVVLIEFLSCFLRSRQRCLNGGVRPPGGRWLGPAWSGPARRLLAFRRHWPHITLTGMYVPLSQTETGMPKPFLPLYCFRCAQGVLVG